VLAHVFRNRVAPIARCLAGELFKFREERQSVGRDSGEPTNDWTAPQSAAHDIKSSLKGSCCVSI
jgi:hypothetical protein